MIESAKLYKDLSLQIMDIFQNNELDKLDKLLNQRQQILDKQYNIAEFKQILIENGILEIDKKIYDLLSVNIQEVKSEIREHRISKQVNNSYMNFSKEKLNIFNQKV